MERAREQAGRPVLVDINEEREEFNTGRARGAT
jgi:hypothetical protein